MDTPVSEWADKSRGMLEDLLRLMQVEATVEASADEDGVVHLSVASPDASLLIGRQGQAIEALDYVVNRMARRAVSEGARCTVDVEGYRARQRETLVKDALELADRAAQTGRTLHMPPLAAADRRAIHRALADRTDIETVSGPADAEGRKRIAIQPRAAAAAPVESAPAPDAPPAPPASDDVTPPETP